jgi:hypothetical protein
MKYGSTAKKIGRQIFLENGTGMYLVNDNNEVQDEFFWTLNVAYCIQLICPVTCKYMQYILDLQIYLELILNC